MTRVGGRSLICMPCIFTFVSLNVSYLRKLVWNSRNGSVLSLTRWRRVFPFALKGKWRGEVAERSAENLNISPTKKMNCCQAGVCTPSAGEFTNIKFKFLPWCISRVWCSEGYWKRFCSSLVVFYGFKCSSFRDLLDKGSYFGAFHRNRSRTNRDWKLRSAFCVVLVSEIPPD